MNGKTVQGYTIVHQRRTEWRGKYDGVFLGECDGKWVAGRQLTGKSRHDGFGENGEWWYATYFDNPDLHEAHRAHEALLEYELISEKAGACWNNMFNQHAGEAIDRHWAKRVPLDQVHDMSAGWVHPGSPGDVRGHTHMLPAVEAKYELLCYMRRSYVVREAFRRFDLREDRSPRLSEAYDAALQAVGPVHVDVDGDGFSLSYDGTYNDGDDRWLHTWNRNPHPDRKGN